MKTSSLLSLASLALASFAVACSAETASSSAEQAGQQQQESNPGPGSPDAATSCGETTDDGGAAAPTGVPPTHAYCASLGYTSEGDQCVFGDGTSCEQWAFYRGECGQAHSYCNQHGGLVANVTEDMGGWTASYAQCTLADGTTCREASFARGCGCE